MSIAGRRGGIRGTAGFFVGVGLAAAAGCEADAPRIATFAASAAVVEPGSDVVLEWRVEGAEEVSLLLPEGPTEVEARGTRTVEALTATTRFVLTARSGDVADARALTVEVDEVGAPRFERLETTPLELRPGAPVEVSWLALRATSVQVAGPGLPPTRRGPQGRLEATVPMTIGSSYPLRLTAAGPGGSVTETRTLIVRRPGAPRILAFSPSALAITRGSTLTLAWRTENAQDVRLYADDALLADELPGEGSLEVQPDEPVRYELVAGGAGAVEPARQMVQVQVAPRPLAIRRFAPTRARVPAGTEVELVWETTQIDRMTLAGSEQGAIAVEPGTRRVQVAQVAPEEMYTLTAIRDLDGGETEVRTSTALAYVDAPPRALELTIAPPVATAQPNRITWRVENAVYANLFVAGLPAQGFPFDAFEGDGAARSESGSLSLAGLGEAELSLVVENAGGRSVLTRRVYAPQLTIASSSSVDLAIPAPDPEVWVAIEVPTGKTVQVDVASSSDAFFASELSPPDGLSLFDGAGQLIATDSGSGRRDDSRLHGDLQPSLRSPAPGTYYLQIRRDAPGTRLPFELRVTYLDVGGCGNTITDPGEACDVGPVDQSWCQACAFTGVDEPTDGSALLIPAGDTAVRGSIGPPNGGGPDEDVYRIEVARGEDLRVRAYVNGSVYCRADQPVTLEVFDPEGARLIGSPREEPPHRVPRSSWGLLGISYLARFEDAIPNDGCVGLGPGPGTDDTYLRRFGFDAFIEATLGEGALRDLHGTSARLEDMAAGTYTVRVRATDPAHAGFDYFLRVEREPPVCGNGIREGNEQCDLGFYDDGFFSAMIMPPVFSCEACRWAGGTVVVDGPGTLTATVSPVQLDLRANNLGVLVEVDTSAGPADAVAFATLYGPQRLAAVPTHWNNFNPGDLGEPIPLGSGRRVVGWGVTGSSFRFSFFPPFFESTATLRIFRLGECGNGVVEPGVGETCDDGNQLDGDGCSSACVSADLPMVSVPSAGPARLTLPAGASRYVGFRIPDGEVGRLERIETSSVAGSPCSGSLTVRYVPPAPSAHPRPPSFPEAGPCPAGTVNNSSFFDGLANPARDLRPGLHLVRVHNEGPAERVIDLELFVRLAELGDGALDSSAGEDCDDGNLVGGDECPPDGRFTEIDLDVEPNDLPEVGIAIDLGSSGPLGGGGLGPGSPVQIQGRVDGARFSDQGVDDPRDAYTFEVPAGPPVDLVLEPYSGAGPGSCETWGETFHEQNVASSGAKLVGRVYDAEGRMIAGLDLWSCDPVTVPGLEPGRWFFDIGSRQRDWTYQLQVELQSP